MVSFQTVEENLPAGVSWKNRKGGSRIILLVVLPFPQKGFFSVGGTRFVLPCGLTADSSVSSATCRNPTISKIIVCSGVLEFFMRLVLIGSGVRHARIRVGRSSYKPL